MAVEYLILIHVRVAGPWTVRSVHAVVIRSIQGPLSASCKHFADAHDNLTDHPQDIDTGLGAHVGADGRGEEHGKPLCEADEHRLVDDKALPDRPGPGEQ